MADIDTSKEAVDTAVKNFRIAEKYLKATDRELDGGEFGRAADMIAALLAERDQWRNTAMNKLELMNSTALRAKDAEIATLRARVAELERVMVAQAEAITDQVRVTRAYAADSDMGANNVLLIEINTSHFLDYADELRAALAKEYGK